LAPCDSRKETAKASNVNMYPHESLLHDCGGFPFGRFTQKMVGKRSMYEVEFGVECLGECYCLKLPQFSNFNENY
jgi:hypothetical protein